MAKSISHSSNLIYHEIKKKIGGMPSYVNTFIKLSRQMAICD